MFKTFRFSQHTAWFGLISLMNRETTWMNVGNVVPPTIARFMPRRAVITYSRFWIRSVLLRRVTLLVRYH